MNLQLCTEFYWVPQELLAIILALHKSSFRRLEHPTSVQKIMHSTPVWDLGFFYVSQCMWQTEYILPLERSSSTFTISLFIMITSVIWWNSEEIFWWKEDCSLNFSCPPVAYSWVYNQEIQARKTALVLLIKLTHRPGQLASLWIAPNSLKNIICGKSVPIWSPFCKTIVQMWNALWKIIDYIYLELIRPFSIMEKKCLEFDVYKKN